MDFTFGICTSNKKESFENIIKSIESIEKQCIPNYEIIIIGGFGNSYSQYNNINRIEFDENIKNNWITKKKNIIAQEAKYENLVIFHDYFSFSKNWYNSFFEIEKDFLECDVCCCPIFMKNKIRHFSDWVTLDHPILGKYFSLNYKNWNETKYQYISGGFFIVKKEFFMKNKLNEKLSWYEKDKNGNNEDVEWSLRIRDKAKIICNPKAHVYHLKIHNDMIGKPRTKNDKIIHRWYI
jgi:hypothetical protein